MHAGLLYGSSLARHCAAKVLYDHRVRVVCSRHDYGCRFLPSDPVAFPLQKAWLPCPTLPIRKFPIARDGRAQMLSSRAGPGQAAASLLGMCCPAQTTSNDTTLSVIITSLLCLGAKCLCLTYPPDQALSWFRC
jgi:hypothetical protein